VYRAVLFFRVVLKPQTHTRMPRLWTRTTQLLSLPAGGLLGAPNRHLRLHITHAMSQATRPSPQRPAPPLSVIRYVPSPAMHVAHLSAPPPPALLSHFLSSPARAHTNGSLTLPLLLLRPAHDTPLRNCSPLPPHHTHSTTSTFSSTHTQHYFVPLSRSLTHKRAH
jgi:hypothetical protein